MSEQYKKFHKGYWTLNRIKGRIDAYVLGAGHRMKGNTKLSENPFSKDEAKELWEEWRQGWLEGAAYQTGKLNHMLLREA